MYYTHYILYTILTIVYSIYYIHEFDKPIARTVKRIVVHTHYTHYTLLSAHDFIVKDGLLCNYHKYIGYIGYIGYTLYHTIPSKQQHKKGSTGDLSAIVAGSISRQIGTIIANNPLIIKHKNLVLCVNE